MTADAVGGVWTYALDLARGLVANGVEVVLAVLGPEPSPHRMAAARAIPGLGVRPTRLALDWTAATPAEVEAAGHRIAFFATEVGADLVHLNTAALAAVAFPVPVVAVAHSCVATWWAAVRGDPLPQDFGWRADLAGRGYGRANAVVAPTRAFAEETRRAYGLGFTPVVVRNGRAGPTEAASRPAGAPAMFALTAGRLWDEGKNLTVLDRAAARLSFPILAAGPLEGPNGAGVGLDHVRPLGELGEAELSAWLQAAPVFVSTALYEPFGLAVLEAAQAGCALVLADIPTFRELWEGAAEFVPPGEDLAVAAAVDRVAADSARRAELGSAARERARLYTVEAMTAGILAVYDGVPAEGRSRGAAA